MKIKLATKRDILPISKMLSREWEEPLSQVKKTVSKKILNKECFFAVENKKIVGVTMYYRDYSHSANYIEYLTVAKEHKRKGIAKRLIRKLVEVAKKEQPKKQKVLLSSTDVSNKISIKLHKKLGFERLGVIKGIHYGRDEIFFGKRLK